MKKTTLLSTILSALFLFSTGLSAQKVNGSGPIVSKKLNLPTFTKISLGTSANVYLTQGKQQSIEIKGQQNIIDLIKKEVTNGEWDINFPKNTRVNFSEKLEIYITLSFIEALNLGGSGSFVGQSKFTNLNNLKLNIGGSGSISLDVQAKDMTCNIGGAGSMNFNGTADIIDINIGGSGSVKAEGLRVDQASVNTAGSGSVKIDVREKLNAVITGSGGVRYKGDPKVKKTIMGSGKVKAL